MLNFFPKGELFIGLLLFIILHPLNWLVLCMLEDVVFKRRFVCKMWSKKKVLKSPFEEPLRPRNRRRYNWLANITTRGDVSGIDFNWLRAFDGVVSSSKLGNFISRTGTGYREKKHAFLLLEGFFKIVPALAVSHNLHSDHHLPSEVLSLFIRIYQKKASIIHNK